MTVASSGRWRVTTASGSIYILDFDAKTVERLPGKDANELRKDSEVIPLLGTVGPLQEGVMMELMIDVLGDGIVTYRSTTAVQSITELIDSV